MLAFTRVCVAIIPTLVYVLLLSHHTSVAEGKTIANERVGDVPEQHLIDKEMRSTDASFAYEPVFAALSRSIIGRQDNNDGTPLQNNEPVRAQITPGQVSAYVFPSSVLHGSPSTATAVIPPSTRKRDMGDKTASHAELRKRQDDVDFHLTLSVCGQPSPSGNSSTGSPPPQLKLFVSLTAPNPISGGQGGTRVPPVQAGFASFSNPTSDNVYIQVQALDTPGYSGSYSFELTGSIDTPYAIVENTPSLYLIDSDSHGAMLISTNLTDPGSNDTSEIEEWEKLGPRFTLAVVNQNNTQMAGLMNSYCAFQNNTQIPGNFAGQNASVDVGLTTIGGDAVKQQFYVSGLNRSSWYYAVMGLPTNYSTSGRGQPGGGGTIWQAMNFTTQSGTSPSHHFRWAPMTSLDENCKVIYNLSFCDEVNYAVPYNPKNQDYQDINLTNWYDSQAQNWWTNFSNALDQVACNTTPDAQYSLAVTCQDCKNSYRQWLCAVTIPRCQDFSSQASYLMPRAIGYPFYNGTEPSVSLDPIFNSTNQQMLALNQSRNPYIDQKIKPGPYKEILPCGAMCYSLVQTCPAALTFACPIEGKGFNSSYGYPRMDGALPQCNIPGQIWGVSAGRVLQPPWMVWTVIAIVFSLVLQWNSD